MFSELFFCVNLVLRRYKMSKSIGKMFGAGGASTSYNPAAMMAWNYLSNLNTSTVDNTYANLQQNAYNLSQNLGNMPSYVYSVDGSDAARQRAEQAYYNNMVNSFQPQFDQQRSDLQTSLANQGLSVGSEAYQRAMNDLTTQQNNAYVNAANQAVASGQDAFSQSLSDAISAGNFTNNARQATIQEILNSLTNSVSGYDKYMSLYGVMNNADNQIAKNDLYNKNAQFNFGNQLLQGGAAALLASDVRVKENIKPVGRLDNGLRVYVFNFIGDDVPQIGLLAQEVQKLHPEAVFEDEQGILRVDYAKAVL